MQRGHADRYCDVCARGRSVGTPSLLSPASFKRLLGRALHLIVNLDAGLDLAKRDEFKIDKGSECGRRCPCDSVNGGNCQQVVGELTETPQSDGSAPKVLRWPAGCDEEPDD